MLTPFLVKNGFWNRRKHLHYSLSCFFGPTNVLHINYSLRGETRDTMFHFSHGDLKHDNTILLRAKLIREPTNYADSFLVIRPE